MNGKRDFGDYQTPQYFSEKVCLYLKNERNINPSIVIEPTCGLGSFLKSSLVFEADKYYGIEINEEYCKYCRENIHDKRISIINDNFFSTPLKSLSENNLNTLVIGNPPWVTNSTLSVLQSNNVPEKSNFKKLKGLDAITGEGNFDICEYILLRIVKEYRDTDTTIAMLCKPSVARNVFKEIKRTGVGFEFCDIVEFDAMKVFGINTNACLFLLQLTEEDSFPDKCRVYSFDNTNKCISEFGYLNGKFYSDFNLVNNDLDGKCCFEWRQGVKHDCSKVMELVLNNNELKNGKKEIVDIESDFVFPLVKSSMFKSPIINSFEKYVIVTQKKVREDTAHIEKKAPKTWKYLNKNAEYFVKRKSSVYKGSPPFSMFGIGDYSFAKYKVGVSGFYKKPLFCLLYSGSNSPVMTDDTSYFLPFDSYDEAYIVMLILNSDKIQVFLKSIAFLDAKRPYTKKVLQRIDFDKITKSLTYLDLVKTESSLGLNKYINESMYNDFNELLKQYKSKQLTLI